MSYIRNMASNPQWANAGRIHDWRNYVSDEVRALWTTFTLRQREALIRQAQDQADNEKWE